MIWLIKKMPPIVARFLNAGYQLGAQGPEAYDCISFVYHFYKELGVSIPSEHEGFNVQNYIQKYKKRPGRAKVFMKQYLSSLGEKVNSIKLGDLVLIKGKEIVMIYIGSGNYLSLHAPVGVMVVPGHAMDLNDMEVRRLCHRH